MPQPTIANARSGIATTRSNRPQQNSRAPEVLNAAESRGREHGPNQAVTNGASGVFERDIVSIGDRQMRENRDEGSALQHHFHFAEPIGAKARGLGFEEAAQA